MAIRIPWDEYETAILILACSEYISGQCSKLDAVKNVSCKLRKRAKLKNIKIDDTFRNENGIKMQIMLIRELLTGQKSGLHRPPKIFIDMVEMYKSDKSKFQDIILKDENGMSRSVVNQGKFAEWLARYFSENKIVEICNTLYELSDIFKEREMIDTTIIGTVDVKRIYDINEFIKENKIFRYVYRSKIDKYSEAILYYYNWLLETNVENVNFESNKIVMKETNRNYVVHKSLTRDGSRVYSDSTKHVIFGSKEDYTFTKVDYLRYNGKIYENIKKWKRLYVILLECLWVDYATDIKHLVGKTIGKAKRIDIGTFEYVSDMKSPKKFANDFYVETNLSANQIVDKMEYLLDFCGIEREDVLIGYSNKKNNIDDAKYHIKKNIDGMLVHSDNVNDDGFQEKTLLLKSFLKQHGLKYVNDEQFLWVLGGRAIKELMKECLSYGFFFRYQEFGDDVTEGRAAWRTKISEGQAMVLSKEISSKGNVVSPICKDSINESYSVVDDKYLDRFMTILQEEYKDGFRIGSIIDIDRFKNFYSEKFSEDLVVSEDKLVYSLKKIGYVRDKRIYATQTGEQCELLQNIYDEMIGIFQCGASCVSVEAVYEKYSDSLGEKTYIYDSDVFRDEMIGRSNGILTSSKDYFVLKNRRENLEEDVLNLFKQSYMPITYTDLKRDWWYIPLKKIKAILTKTKAIVNVAPESYFYARNFPISQDEINILKKCFFKALNNKTYLTDVELCQLTDSKCQSLEFIKTDFKPYGIRACLAYIFGDSFSFTGQIITEKGKEVSVPELFLQYCKNREQFNTDELKSFAAEMKTSIYWDVVREHTIRVSNMLFLRNDQLIFEVEKVDEILDDIICNREYMPLKDVGLFVHFPGLSVPWNSYVLESFIYAYSHKFKLIHVSFSESGFFGAMVRKTSAVQDYRMLIIDVLGNSFQWKNAEDALELLVEQGYQQRRRYSDIESVVREAKILRDKLSQDELR